MEEMNNQVAVALSGVTKSYGHHLAVDDLTLSVPRGAIYGFIGPNGSGKTTTIRMILHILLADVGTIEVLGQTGRRAANDRIGYLPEERGLYKKHKILGLLEYYGTLKGMTRAEARSEGSRWLDRMGIAEWADKKIENLSKGMAQKVQFIATVIARPELIILDEPFSGLDPVNQDAIREAMLELRKEGATIIFSTHDMSMAEQLCETVFMIYKGKKVLDGTMTSIREIHGLASVRLRLEGGPSVLEGMPGVESFRDLGEYQEVTLKGDSNAFLVELMTRTRVHHFEEKRPSLHDIFVSIAKPKVEELTDVE